MDISTSFKKGRNMTIFKLFNWTIQIDHNDFKYEYKSNQSALGFNQLDIISRNQVFYYFTVLKLKFANNEEKLDSINWFYRHCVMYKGLQ